MQLGIPIGFGLLAAGEALQPVVPTLGTLTQFGAVGVLAWVAWTQRQELVAFRKKLDFWENVRHDDSNKLNDTLRENATHCAATIAELRKNEYEK